MSEEIQKTEAEVMAEEKSEEFNRKTAELTSIFLKEIASLPAEEIYNLSFTKRQEENLVLLETINRTFKHFLEVGDGLPREFFENYATIADSILHTFKLNIKSKCDVNIALVLAQAVGKDTEDISHTDIERTVVNPVEETPVETEAAE